ncbi:uroplakin-3b-like protein 2 [Cebus imitator]|uniref:uroplakin-3b-like protein 2 n=1 Tax=Cebus imitator TaxID=2715852 RepID=UPI000809C419|nr:uroplakin-3b-like protein 2 [Cebus imitator]
MDRQMDNSRRLGPAMGLSAGQCQLLMSLLLLLTRVQPGTGVEHIHYVPQLSKDTLAGRLTQSTFTLEQPLGQFNSHNISDVDTIWLVVALSNATQSFTAPQTNQDIPAPASFSQRGYYLTMGASRALYQGSQASSQLRVLRVGNDTHCQLTKPGCNHPLPGPGPYRVKFLVMNEKGPVAETDWSNDTRLQQAQELPAVRGPQSPGTVVIIAILSVLLALLLTALLAVLIYTCFNSCRSTSLSGPEKTESVRRYTTHLTFSTPAEGSS